MLLDRLEPADRAALGALDDDVYGVLRPRPGAPLALRSATTDTALLFLSLVEPGPLPMYVVRALGGDRERTIGRLVVDGVLELEYDGVFRSGPEAGAQLLSERAAGGRGRVGELSRAALRYGQELTGLPAALVAQRLYFYGRVPVTARLRRRLDGEVGAQAPGWVPHEDESPYWRSWRARGAAADGATFKLYVSPALDAVAPAFEAVVVTLASAPGVKAFKIARNAPGLCRPDKLVVYFDRLDDLHAAANRLRERLDGCPAQGVPFTSAITLDGMLSWGADPPMAGTSWRLWVAERLADHLVDASAAVPSELEPWQFALERLRLGGIDTETWAPSSGMWEDALASA